MFTWLCGCVYCIISVIFLKQTIFLLYQNPYKVFQTHPDTCTTLASALYHDRSLCMVTMACGRPVKVSNCETHTHIDKKAQPRGMAWPVPATTIGNSKFQSPGISSKLCKAELLSENVYFMTDEQPYFQGLRCQWHSMFAKDQPITP